MINSLHHLKNSAEDKQVLKCRNKDTKIDPKGKELLYIRICNQIRILNDRVLGDTFLNLTCYIPSGTRTVDYVLLSESILNQVLYMKVHSFNPLLPDCYCMLEWSMSAKYCDESITVDSDTRSVYTGYIWSDESLVLFQEAPTFKEIHSQIDTFTNINIDNHKYDSKNVINEALLALMNILITTAYKSLKRRKLQNPRKQNKKWFTGDLFKTADSRRA